MTNLFVRIGQKPEDDLRRGFSYAMGAFGDSDQAHVGLSGYEAVSGDEADLRTALQRLSKRMGLSGYYSDPSGRRYPMFVTVYEGLYVGTGPDSEDLFAPKRLVVAVPTHAESDDEAMIERVVAVVTARTRRPNPTPPTGGTFTAYHGTSKRLKRLDPWRGAQHIHRALPLAEVLRWRQEAARRGVSEVARGPGGFLPAYEAAGGSLGRMSPWWRARREAFLARHLAQVAAHHERLFESDGLPTRRHLALVMWAYSPAPSRLPRGPTMRHPNPRAPGRWFHGTSLEAAEKILAAGRIEAPRELAPHYTGRTAQWFAPMQGYVYLTNDIELGLKYAHMRAYKGRGKYGVGALIEVMPDEPCLPDEDEIGQALAIVLFDDQSQPVDDRDDVAALGRAVLEAVPRPLRKRWEASGARAAGWTGARKAKEGKAAIAALAPHVIDALAGKTRSIACVGATPLKAVAVPPRYHELVRPIQAEELARREREMGRERAIWADYVAIKPRVYERFFDESEPILTPMRHANPKKARGAVEGQRARSGNRRKALMKPRPDGR